MIELKATREGQRYVLLNTAILPSHGRFEYRPSTLPEICHMLNDAERNGVPVLSAIGHKSTAQVLTKLFGKIDHPVPVNRIEYRQEPGDVAIVFKLRGRPPEGKILSVEEIEEIGYDFVLLITENKGGKMGIMNCSKCGNNLFHIAIVDCCDDCSENGVCLEDGDEAYTYDEKRIFEESLERNEVYESGSCRIGPAFGSGCHLYTCSARGCGRKTNLAYY